MMAASDEHKPVPIWRSEIWLAFLLGCLAVFVLFPGSWSAEPALAPPTMLSRAIAGRSHTGLLAASFLLCSSPTDAAAPVCAHAAQGRRGRARGWFG